MSSRVLSKIVKFNCQAFDTPLHIAVKHRDIASVKNILNTNDGLKMLYKRNFYGDTPLNISKANEDRYMIKTLINKMLGDNVE